MTTTGRLDPAIFSEHAVSEETRLLNARIAAAMAAMPEWWTVGAPAVRAARLTDASGLPTIQRSERAKTIEIDGPAGKLRMRLLAAARPRGVYLHFHGGGHVLGAADQQDWLLEYMADALGLTAISVDYRLAPENPYPAQPDDCEAAALWVLDHLEELGGSQLVVGGESAGAHVAVLTLIRLRDRHGLTPFRAANLCFGVYDMSLSPSARAFGNDERLALRTIDAEQFSAAFLGDIEDRRAPEVSPLYANLKGLCPALFTVGTRDALLDDSMFMHARWIAAGNQGKLDVYPGACHGFIQFPTRQARASLRTQKRFLLRWLDGSG